MDPVVVRPSLTPSLWAVHGAAAPPPPGTGGPVCLSCLCPRPATRPEPLPLRRPANCINWLAPVGYPGLWSLVFAAALPLTRLDRAEPPWPLRPARGAMSWVSRVQAASAILIAFRQFASENLEERTRMPCRVPACASPTLLPLPLGVGRRGLRWLKDGVLCV
jgi:hypothetical protein